jgi:GrpB-like predicted nucleotidyltransferase (UPF0157 family)
LLPSGSDIRHVGATSTPGALTKGDLDIAVRVIAEDFAAAQAMLDASHFQNLKSVRDATFSAYEADGFAIPVGVQLVVRGSRLDVFERVRQALLSDPVRLAQYNALKQRFDGQPMADYRAAKAAFIQQIVQS